MRILEHCRLAFTILVAGMLVVACSQAPVYTQPWHGDYVLVNVDGISIPGNVDHDGTIMMLHKGSFSIRGDDTCVSKTRFSVHGHMNTRHVICDYQEKGGAMVMRWRGAGITRGTVSDGQFVMDNHGMIFTYRKE